MKLFKVRAGVNLLPLQIQLLVKDWAYERSSILGFGLNMLISFVSSKNETKFSTITISSKIS